MGVRNYIYPLIIDSIIRNFKLTELSDLLMCELGNQDIAVDGIEETVTKTYFESLGMNHISLDLNGEDGALKIDMAKPLNEVFINNFDIITNIGFSEHVQDSQYECFNNIHKLCKLNGIMIHNLPVSYCNPPHGRYQYPTEFFTELASKCGYELLCQPFNVNWPHREMGDKIMMNYVVKDRDLICAAFKKVENNDFISPNDFASIPIVDMGSDVSSHIPNFKIYEVRE